MCFVSFSISTRCLSNFLLRRRGPSTTVRSGYNLGTRQGPLFVLTFCTRARVKFFSLLSFRRPPKKKKKKEKKIESHFFIVDFIVCRHLSSEPFFCLFHLVSSYNSEWIYFSVTARIKKKGRLNVCTLCVLKRKIINDPRFNDAQVSTWEIEKWQVKMKFVFVELTFWSGKV